MNISERGMRWLLIGVGAGAYVMLMALEFITEQDDISLGDFVVDAASMLLVITSAVGVALLVQRMQTQHEEKLNLIRDLDIARAEGDGWRTKVQSHLAGLRGEMDRQFQDWGLTGAEREVGLMILKGLSHKEIAALRATTEATVRQQAQSIYRKAELPGKTAFSAYFLEDLLTPDMMRDDPATSAAANASRGLRH